MMNEGKGNNLTAPVTEPICTHPSQVSGIHHSAQNQSKSCLPNDVMQNILLRLPVKDLYEKVRYVCKEWYNIVNDPTFINAHFEMSSTGIIIQESAESALYLETIGAEIKVTESSIPFHGKVLGSCRGLVLFHDLMNPELFHVVNLITKEKVSLPPLAGLRRLRERVTALSYASSGCYKVVHVSKGLHTEPQVMVCTVGIDRAWRKIDLEGIPMINPSKLVFFHPPYVVAGLIYWLAPMTSARGFALDVDAELMYQFSTPESYDTAANLYTGACITLETGLGLVDFSGNRAGLWVVWELVDVKTGKWRKVLDIDRTVLGNKIETVLYPRAQRLTWPLLCMKNGDFWLGVVIDVGFALVCYNLRKGTILLSDLNPSDLRLYGRDRDPPYPHVNTLVQLKNG